ncbi:hypothetical protein Sjap_024228 [Stephania japonica]|uniref:Rab-GAP TBC domain-containing protein n=1 Tax=Stephania japonica TaxID=461633 RepID=A0AAP0HNR8_9MAGN
MVVVWKCQPRVLVAVFAVSMFWWNSRSNGRRGRGSVSVVEASEGSSLIGNGSYNGGGFLGTLWPSHFGIAVAVTAIAGIAVAVTIIYSNSGSLKSPWCQRRRKNALSSQQWKLLFTPDGKLCDGGMKFLKKVRSGGVDPSIRNEVWPFLLGVYDLNSTQEERDSIRASKRNEYDELRRQCKRLLLKLSDHILNGNGKSETDSSGNSEIVIQSTASPCPDVVSSGELLSIDRMNTDSKDSDGHINHAVPSASDLVVSEDDGESGITSIDADADANANASVIITESSESDQDDELKSTQALAIVAESKKHSSNDSCVSNAEENKKVVEDFDTWQRIIRLDAVRTNGEWIPFSPVQAAVSDGKARQLAEEVGLKDYDHLEPCRIFHAARLVAVLEAYAIYDPEIGYCQGMSDLCSPIIAVMEEDHDAFWCFVGFMRKARHNFRLDEVGIRRQLNLVSKIIKLKDSHLYRHLEMLQAEDCFFVYRMVVVLFRRELTFEQTLCLWEVMWADQAAVKAGIGKSAAWGRIRLRAPPPTDDLLLYAIAASVLQRRKLIIEKYSSMDEIIRECNSMAGHLDVWKLLDDAHGLVMSIHERI